MGRSLQCSSAGIPCVLWIALFYTSIAGLLATPAARAVETTALDFIPISTNTGEKPQSKAWHHAGTWWVVLPNDSPAGTWIWRLEPDDSFAAVLRLSTSTDAKADVIAVGDTIHPARDALCVLHQEATQRESRFHSCRCKRPFAAAELWHLTHVSMRRWVTFSSAGVHH